MLKNKSRIISLMGLGSNILFCLYHIIVGILTSSWWMLTIGTYYIFLSMMRFFVLKSKSNGRFIRKVSGVMFIGMVVPLVGTVILASVKDRGTRFHMIIMIAIATYAFSKIVLAIIKLIKSRKIESAKTVVLRKISFADALVSIFSLQRSMLVSFEGMSELEIRVMNVATGICVCILVVALGINLLFRAKKI